MHSVFAAIGAFSASAVYQLQVVTAFTHDDVMITICVYCVLSTFMCCLVRECKNMQTHAVCICIPTPCSCVCLSLCITSSECLCVCTCQQRFRISHDVCFQHDFTTSYTTHRTNTMVLFVCRVGLPVIMMVNKLREAIVVTGATFTAAHRYWIGDGLRRVGPQTGET